MNCVKARVMQNSSEFSFLFIYIWFDRAWKADHEYIVFISNWPLFGRKKLKLLRNSHFDDKFLFSTEIIRFQVQSFCELFENIIFWFSIKNCSKKCSLNEFKVNRAVKILYDINTGTYLKVCISRQFCIPIYFFVTWDITKCHISLESPHPELQKYPFSF